MDNAARVGEIPLEDWFSRDRDAARRESQNLELYSLYSSFISQAENGNELCKTEEQQSFLGREQRIHRADPRNSRADFTS